MRKATFASMLILCGSTAAIAQTMSTPVEQRARNSNGNAMANEVAPDTPATASDNGPPEGTSSPTGDTPISDAVSNEATPGTATDDAAPRTSRSTPTRSAPRGR